MKFWPAAALLLGGCAGAPLPAGPAAFCDQVAAADPSVKALILRGVSDPSFIPRQGYEVAEAKQQVKTECLRRQGFPPQGEGVKPPPQTGTLYP